MYREPSLQLPIRFRIFFYLLASYWKLQFCLLPMLKLEIACARACDLNYVLGDKFMKEVKGISFFFLEKIGIMNTSHKKIVSRRYSYHITNLVSINLILM